MSPATVKEPTTPALRHLEGCPAGEDKVETYAVTSERYGPAIVTRCQQCGAHQISRGDQILRRE